jgi:hypothetical protein
MAHHYRRPADLDISLTPARPRAGLGALTPPTRALLLKGIGAGLLSAVCVSLMGIWSLVFVLPIVAVEVFMGAQLCGRRDGVLAGVMTLLCIAPWLGTGVLLHIVLLIWQFSLSGAK